MKISEYILELLTNEHEANMLENEQNFYGADVCREEFDADWEDWLCSLSDNTWEVVRRVRSQAVRLMRGVGYDRAMAEVSRLAVNEQDI